MEWREVVIETRKMVVVLLKELRGSGSSSANEGQDDDGRKRFNIILKGILMEMHSLISNIANICRQTLDQDKMFKQHFWFTDIEVS